LKARETQARSHGFRFLELRFDKQHHGAKHQQQRPRTPTHIVALKQPLAEPAQLHEQPTGCRRLVAFARTIFSDVEDGHFHVFLP
jgi:hypothetical protein